MTGQLSRDRPNLLWLEDRELTASIEVAEAKKLGCKVHIRAHPLEIMSLLNGEFGPNQTRERFSQFRIAFIIDIMIAGLVDLQAFGLERSETKGGLNAGYVFVDRVLRADTSACRFSPVCFLSERQLTQDLEDDLQYLRNRKDADGTPHGDVYYIKKKNSKELQKFKTFVGSVL